MREIEVKLKVKNLEDIEEKLKARGCFLSESINQYDVIYSKKSAEKEFEKTKEGDVIIRIRYQDDIAQLNLKKQCSNEMDSLEYETEIKNSDQMHKMLLALGWRPSIEVKKVRKKGKLGEYEICLDRVEKLGTFIELEKLTEDNINPEEVRNELLKELESLGLSQKDEETKGYDTQIYQLGLNKK